MTKKNITNQKAAVQPPPVVQSTSAVRPPHGEFFADLRTKAEQFSANNRHKLEAEEDIIPPSRNVVPLTEAEIERKRQLDVLEARRLALEGFETDSTMSDMSHFPVNITDKQQPTPAGRESSPSVLATKSAPADTRAIFGLMASRISNKFDFDDNRSVGSSWNYEVKPPAASLPPVVETPRAAPPLLVKPPAVSLPPVVETPRAAPPLPVKRSAASQSPVVKTHSVASPLPVKPPAASRSPVVKTHSVASQQSAFSTPVSDVRAEWLSDARATQKRLETMELTRAALQKTLVRGEEGLEVHSLEMDARIAANLQRELSGQDEHERSKKVKQEKKDRLYAQLEQQAFDDAEEKERQQELEASENLIRELAEREGPAQPAVVAARNGAVPAVPAPAVVAARNDAVPPPAVVAPRNVVVPPPAVVAARNGAVPAVPAPAVVAPRNVVVPPPAVVAARNGAVPAVPAPAVVAARNDAVPPPAVVAARNPGWFKKLGLALLFMFTSFVVLRQNNKGNSMGIPGAPSLNILSKLPERLASVNNYVFGQSAAELERQRKAEEAARLRAKGLNLVCGTVGAGAILFAANRYRHRNRLPEGIENPQVNARPNLRLFN